MTDLLNDVDTPSDAELISRVRGGDVDCLRRPVRPPRATPPTGWPASWSAARDADDLVSEAFAKVLARAPGRRRPGRRLPRLPAHRRTPAARRPDPRRAAAAHHRRPDAVRPGRAVPGHRGRRLRERRGGQGVRLAARALAAGAVAPRGRGPEARRHRAAARDERQLGLRAGLPGPRGAPPGVPDHAHRRPDRRPSAGGSTSTSARSSATACPSATAARSRQHLDGCRTLHRDVPRADRGQLEPGRHHRAAAARRGRDRVPRLQRGRGGRGARGAGVPGQGLRGGDQHRGAPPPVSRSA